MRCVYIIAVSALLAGCSSWADDYSSAGMAPVMSSSNAVSAGPSARTAVYLGDTDEMTDHDALALRQSAWRPARLRGDITSIGAAGFCKAVASAAASTASYDPATSRQVEATRLTQCREMAGL
jgi:hypothetical protein